MKAKLATAIAALDSLVNYFIPADIAADRDTRNRAHVFLVSHILGPFIGSVVPITIYVLDPAPGYDVAVLATSIIAFWAFPFILRAGVPYNPLALVSIENLIFCIVELLLLRRRHLTDAGLGARHSAACVLLPRIFEKTGFDRRGDVRGEHGDLRLILFLWFPGQ